MSEKQKLANFINGEYVAPAGGKYFDSFNPATGEAYALVPDSDKNDIDRAVAAAKAAFPAWSAKSTNERAAVLTKIADGIEKNMREFAKAESIDQGKTFRLAYAVEIPRAIKNFRYFAQLIREADEKTVCTEDNKAVNFTQRVPLGVAGLISPWNLPLYLITWKIAPALAAGNTAVCKPSEMTSMTAHMLGQVMNEAGLPPGVCNMVMGLGGKVGDALVRHPDVKVVSFTGGTATGKIISAAAAGKRLSLELGGKNPGVIFADADLDECIPTTVRSSFQNQGEICLCNSRLYVEEKIFPQFMERFVKATQEFKPGDPLDKDSSLGALISKEHQKKVLGYIELAKSEGAKVHCGGGVPQLGAPFDKGYFVEPTILSGVKHESRVQQEEIFGPVVTVTPFRDEAEALRLANGVKYGLSSSVWTGDKDKAQRVARKLEAGTVWINSWMIRDVRVPFGGMKDSGIGREGGEHSLDFFTELKNICVAIPS